ncbi:MAG: DUF2807 domain-containing protein [Flavobacteriaceae bacterium]|nr:MAG: DUF2807 domain-containing protein [Flavobacteriaceae bacterium]
MKTKITLLLLVLFTATSCMFDGFGIQGSRNVISEDRKINADFEAIKVSQGISVFLTQSNDTELRVEADDNIIDLLVTEVEGDVLKIYFDKNVSRAKARNVYLSVSKINRIKTTSGAEVRGEGVIKSKTMELAASSGSEIVINLDAQSVSADSSSGSEIEVSGSTDSFKGDASSGSEIDAGDLISKTGNVDVSSGAEINVHSTDKLTAHASSGGSINFEGNPSVLNKSKSSGGSISKH